MFEISRVYPTYIYSSTVSSFSPLFFSVSGSLWDVFSSVSGSLWDVFFFFSGEDFVMFRGVIEFGVGWLGLFPLRSVFGFFKCGYC